MNKDSLVSLKQDQSAILLTANSALQKQVCDAFEDKSIKEMKFFNCTKIDEALAMVTQHKPLLILVDISVDELENLAVWLQKVRTNVVSASAAIVLLCTRDVQNDLLPMAAEYAINNILVLDILKDVLVPVVYGILVDFKKPSSMKSIINRIEQAGAKNSLGELDVAALDFYTLFPKEKRACVEYANYCIRRCDWDKAKEVLSQVMQKSPNDLRAINSMVRVLLREHDVDNAVEWLNKAELLSPSNVNRMVLLGDVYREKGVNDIAKAKYSQAMKIIPECREAKQGMAAVQLSEGEVSDALKLFSESSSQEETASYFNDAAIIAVHKTKYIEAQKLYHAALGALNNPKIRAKVIFNIGLAYHKENIPEKATEYFMKATKEDPEYARPRTTLIKMGVNVPLEGDYNSGFANNAEMASDFLTNLNTQLANNKASLFEDRVSNEDFGQAESAFSEASLTETSIIDTESKAKADLSDPAIIAQKDQTKSWEHWDPSMMGSPEPEKNQTSKATKPETPKAETPKGPAPSKKETKKKQTVEPPKFLDDE